jgi:ABC-type sugar transport system, periplasmic component
MSAQKVVTLNVWDEWITPTDVQTIAMKNAITSFEKANPNIKINHHSLEDNSYKTKIATEFASSADNVDDFVYWAPGKIQKLLKAQKILPIDKYVSKSDLKLIKKGTLASFQSGGKLYALPMNSFMMLLFCNTDIFKKAGVAVPKTFSQLLTVSAKIKKLNITPMALGARDAWKAGALYEALAVDEVGAQNVNNVLLGNAKFNNPGFKSAADKVIQLYKAGVLGQNPLEDASADSDAKFFNNQAAMYYNGSWFCSSIDSDKGGMKNHIAIVKFPTTNKSKATDYDGGSNSSFFVNKATANPKEAAQFAIYVSKYLGIRALSMGAGYSTWNTTQDTSKISKTFSKTLPLYNNSVDGVLTWDTLLSDNPSSIHLEQAQMLLSDQGSSKTFIDAQKKYIGKQ